MGNACARHVINGRRTERLLRADGRARLRRNVADPVGGCLAQSANELNQKYWPPRVLPNSRCVFA